MPDRGQAAPEPSQEDSISVEPRINDRIRVPEVRLVGPNGEQVGIVPISRALDMAVQADLDLVEVAPTARPPVVKIMDYGKFKYENAQKAREARRNQVLTVIKEMKLRPKIDGHDYETKKGHVVRFLKVGDKVKVTIMFRGREQSRPELGFRLLQKLATDVADLGFVESAPKLDGRNMIMVLAPHKAPAKPAKAPSPAPRPRAEVGSPDENSLVGNAADDGLAPAADLDTTDLVTVDGVTDTDSAPAPIDAAPAPAAAEPPAAAAPAAFAPPAPQSPPTFAPASSGPRPQSAPSGTRSAPTGAPRSAAPLRPGAPTRTGAPARPASPPAPATSANPAPTAAPRPAGPSPVTPRPAVRPPTSGTPGKPGGAPPLPTPRPRPGAPVRPPKPGS